MNNITKLIVIGRDFPRHQLRQNLSIFSSKEAALVIYMCPAETLQLPLNWVMSVDLSMECVVTLIVMKYSSQYSFSDQLK